MRRLWVYVFILSIASFGSKALAQDKPAETRPPSVGTINAEDLIGEWEGQTTQERAKGAIATFDTTRVTLEIRGPKPLRGKFTEIGRGQLEFETGVGIRGDKVLLRFRGEPVEFTLTEADGKKRLAARFVPKSKQEFVHPLEVTLTKKK